MNATDHHVLSILKTLSARPCSVGLLTVACGYRTPCTTREALARLEQTGKVERVERDLYAVAK